MHQLLEIWFQWVLNWGYLGIIILMAMESSIFPVPSEVVIPPAAFLAAQGHLDFTGVVLGRPLIMRDGKYFLLGPGKLERAEAWLARYEAGGVFFARLLPVIRHLISIPAGIVRMNFTVFSVVTITGSAIWCYILAYLGRKAHQLRPDLISNPEAMVAFIKTQSLWIILLVALLAVLYLIVMRLSARRAV
jgi:membrane protein DedA with SNARE-associated domain